MHQHAIFPDSRAQDIARNTTTGELRTTGLLSVKRETALAFQRLSNELPAGLNRPLRQMLQSLVAVADSRPAGMFSDLIVEVTTNRVLVGPSSDDPVVHGIQRRFTVRAAQTCHRCGRRGRARQDLGGRVRCARCAAPALVLQAIQQVLRQDRTARDIDSRVEVVEVPPLLRPMFRMHVENHLQNAPGTTNEMSHEMFTVWLKLLRDLAREIRHGTATAR